METAVMVMPIDYWAYIIKCGREGNIDCYETCYIQIQQIVLSFFACWPYLVNNSLYFSQNGRFPLMLAAHPDVIKALRQAAVTEQVR